MENKKVNELYNLYVKKYRAPRYNNRRHPHEWGIFVGKDFAVGQRLISIFNLTDKSIKSIGLSSIGIKINSKIDSFQLLFHEINTKNEFQEKLIPNTFQIIQVNGQNGFKCCSNLFKNFSALKPLLEKQIEEKAVITMLIDFFDTTNFFNNITEHQQDILRIGYIRSLMHDGQKDSTYLMNIIAGIVKKFHHKVTLPETPSFTAENKTSLENNQHTTFQDNNLQRTLPDEEKNSTQTNQTNASPTN